MDLEKAAVLYFNLLLHVSPGNGKLWISQDSLYQSGIRTASHLTQSPPGYRVLPLHKPAGTMSGHSATWHVNHMAVPCLASINSALAHPCQPSPNNIEVHLHFKLEVSCHILLRTASCCVCESQRSSCLRVQIFTCFFYTNLIANLYFPMFLECNRWLPLSGSRYLWKSCPILTRLSPSM
jgi:hypothetical protein